MIGCVIICRANNFLDIKPEPGWLHEVGAATSAHLPSMSPWKLVMLLDWVSGQGEC